MRGFLKNKPAFNQLLIVAGVTLMSLFVIGAIGSLIVSFVAGVPFSEMADTKNWNYSSPKTIFVVRGMLLVQFFALCVIPSYVAARLFGENNSRYLGLRPPSNLIYFVAGVALLLFSTPLVGWLGELNKNIQFPSGIESWMQEKENEAGETAKGLLSLRTPSDLLMNIFFIGVLAGVGEELLFRGVIQRILIRLFKNNWAGILVAAFVFSAVHFQFYGFVPRFLLGIFLGLIYWYSGSLWPSILAHTIYNSAQVILVYYNPEMITKDNPVETANLLVMALISAAISIGIIWWMKTKSTTAYKEVYADDMKPYKDHPF
ncbi:MAG TPA: CPBP family intramembrane metalloprotease [Chitinophagaceae bacterium]|jgi:membrane protease YdiL (CAAX protease family)|nr:CPBP family intramembrane metalloprotease [Chitinophagaceae bacterium]HMU56904.1 CPBP family intramembrane metalloprotease [Chitinophagaceae bacterium]